MATREALEAVRYLEACLREAGLSISKMILFGSHVEGDATAESDVDVAVVSEDFQDRDIFQRADLVKDAHGKVVRKFKIPLDIVPLTPEELDNGTSPAAQYARAGTAV